MDNVLIEYFNDKDINSNLQDIANKVEELILENYIIISHRYMDIHDGSIGTSENHDNGFDIQCDLDSLIDDNRLESESWYEICLQKEENIIILRTGIINWDEKNMREYEELKAEYVNITSNLNRKSYEDWEKHLIEDKVFDVIENEDNYWLTLSDVFRHYDNAYYLDIDNKNKSFMEQGARFPELSINKLFLKLQEFSKHNLSIICGELFYNYPTYEKDNDSYLDKHQIAIKGTPQKCGYLQFRNTNFEEVIRELLSAKDFNRYDRNLEFGDSFDFYVAKDGYSNSFFKPNPLDKMFTKEKRDNHTTLRLSDTTKEIINDSDWSYGDAIEEFAHILKGDSFTSTEKKNYAVIDNPVQNVTKESIFSDLNKLTNYYSKRINNLETEIQKDDVSYNALEKVIEEKDKEICDLKYGKNAVSTVNGFKPVDNIPVTRESTEYKHWVEAICKRDNSTCQICGEDSKPHVHHIYSYKDYPDLRVDMNNGIVLCKWHHNKYHEFYGYKNINPKTLLEFTIRELKR